MEQINAAVLNDPAMEPTEAVLRGILGRSFGAYEEMLRLFDANGITYAWRYYRDGKAWLCKVERKKKTIAWMSAWNGFIKATIYIPGKHLDELRGVQATRETVDRLMGAKNVGESKPCMFEIRDASVLEDFNAVMQFKMAIK